MPSEELEANFSAILKDIESCRARPTGVFVTRCYVLSPPSTENFVVNTEPYLGKMVEDSSSSSSSSDDESDDDNETPRKPEEAEDDRSRARAA